MGKTSKASMAPAENQKTAKCLLKLKRRWHLLALILLFTGGLIALGVVLVIRGATKEQESLDQAPWKVPLLVVLVVEPVLLCIAATTMVLICFKDTVKLHRSTMKYLVRKPAEDADLNHMEVPFEKLIAMLAMILSGDTPPENDVHEIMMVLQQGQDLYLPSDLRERMRQTIGDQGEITEALVRALMPDTAPSSYIQHPSSPPNSQTFGGLIYRISDNNPAFEGAGYTNMIQALQSIVGLEPRGSKTRSCSFDEDAPAKFLLSSFSEVHNEESLIGTEMSFAHAFMPPVRPVTNSLVGKLERVLMTAAALDGSFNSWELGEVSQHHPLSSLAYWCFYESGMIQDMKVSARQLATFLRTVESGYLDNPYHNKTHAADVVQSVHAFIHTAGLRGKHLDNMDVMACYIAAIIHDYNHKGVTNDFLIGTGDDLAMRYNDASPHENHHVSAGLSLLNDSECNFLQQWTKAERAKLRKMVIELVLATDMKRHFNLVTTFNNQRNLALMSDLTATPARKSLLDSGPSSPRRDSAGTTDSAGQQLRKTNTTLDDRDSFNPVASVFVNGPTSMPLVGLPEHTAVTIAATKPERKQAKEHKFAASVPSNAIVQPELQPLNDTDKLLTMQIMLKCADLGHTCAVLPVHLQWVKALQAEMFLQGDRERKMALPVSPLCNREGMGITQSQVSFFEVVILPLLRSFTSRYPKASPAFHVANANYLYWKG